MNRPSLLRSLPVVAGLLAGCTGLLANVTETLRQTYPLSAEGTVSVANVNGTVEIIAWDKPEVSLVAERRAPDDEQLKRIRIVVDAQPGHFNVKTEQDKGLGGLFGLRSPRGEVRYQLMVPAGATLGKIDTVNANVRCTGVKGPVQIDTVNGSITADGLAASGQFDTVNGSITVAYDQLPAASRVKLDTVNGSCRLTLPKEAGLVLDASNVNGRITCDRAIQLEKSGSHHLRGTIGSGGAQVKLDSVNGSLHIAAR